MSLNSALAGVVAALFLAERPDSGLSVLALLGGCAAVLAALDLGLRLLRMLAQRRLHPAVAH